MRAGEDVGRDQVARLMAELGIYGVRRGRKVRTTRPDEAAARPADLVERRFKAVRPNQLWVTDLTYVATWAGTVYVCFIVDVFSRTIVGCRTATNMRTDMVLDALEMAGWSRGTRLEGLGCHSDAGSQFTSIVTASAWPRSEPCPPSARSATASIMPWPRRSTVSTRPSSSAGEDRGATSTTSNSVPGGSAKDSEGQDRSALNEQYPDKIKVGDRYLALWTARGPEQQLVVTLMLPVDQNGVVTHPFSGYDNKINVNTYQPSAVALRVPAPRSGQPEIAGPDPDVPVVDPDIEAAVEAQLPSLPRGSAREDLRKHEEKRNELRERLQPDKARGSTTTTVR